MTSNRTWGSLHWEHGVSTNGPPGKACIVFIFLTILKKERKKEALEQNYKEILEAFFLGYSEGFLSHFRYRKYLNKDIKQTSFLNGASQAERSLSGFKICVNTDTVRAC